MKRTIATIKMQDYVSKEDFIKDVPRMKRIGYTPITNEMFNGAFPQGEIDTEDYKYTAAYIKYEL